MEHEHVTGSRIANRTRKAALALMLCASGALSPAFAALTEAEAAMQKQDFKTAAKEWTALADKGDAHAQSTLAMMYSAGLGVQKDAAKAYALNRKAAEQNHARSQWMLSLALAQGDGVRADPEASLLWLKKAADQGLMSAQADLGTHYMQKQQFGEGVNWLNKAASAGSIPAMVDLGIALIRGDGVGQDLAKAYQLMYIAGDMGGNEKALELKQRLVPHLTADEMKRAETEAALWSLSHQPSY